MASGDGLIVRVRPRCGALSLGTAIALAGLGERLGNGHIDLTRRANLQIRGVAYDRLGELQAELASLGLLDRDAETEAVRNIMVAPLAGIDPTQPFDVRPIALAIDDALTMDRRLHALPGKFGLLIDGGGAISIASERADICLAAHGNGLAFGLDTSRGTQWLGEVEPAQAAETAIAVAHAFLAVANGGRMRSLSEAAFAKVQAAVAPRLSPLTGLPSVGRRRLGLLKGAVGIAAPFGRLEASQLRRLAELAADAGAMDLRLSPWRTVYFSVREESGVPLLEEARAAGLIVHEGDPLLQVEACPGAPDCKSSSVDARSDARHLATVAALHGWKGSIHVSGCAKGCARSLPSRLVLAGQGGTYRLIRNATTRGAVERMIGVEEFETLFNGTLDD